MLPFRSLRKTVLFCAFLAGCAAINAPLNQPAGTGNLDARSQETLTGGDDDIYIGLAFSGGGTRASSFAFGLLEELRASGRSSKNPDGLLKYVRLVSGVSGGSVTAAYYGLHGPAGLDRYRDTYLVQDAEKYMSTAVWNPVTLVKGVSGGANSRTTFARFLDETIFNKATFADLAKNRRTLTWINASDVANNTPFLFAPETFDALCSDLRKLPISEAVAASAAFPLVFSPIVLEAHGNSCQYKSPDWLVAAKHNPESTSAMKAYARALESYHDPAKIKYVKLLDGGITDNFGTTGLSLARAKAQNDYGPLTPREAVRLKRIMFLVANAGTQEDYSWSQKVQGPGAVALVMSIVNSSMSAATRVGYDVMRLTLAAWHQDLVDYRCKLPLSEVAKHRGTAVGWDCTDLKLFVGEVSFEGLGPDMTEQLNKIPTRLKLPVADVDLAIKAARLSTQQNPEFNGFLHSLDGYKPTIGEGATRISPRRIAPVKN